MVPAPGRAVSRKLLPRACRLIRNLPHTHRDHLPRRDAAPLPATVFEDSLRPRSSAAG